MTWTLTVDASVERDLRVVGVGIVIQHSDSSRASKRGPIRETIAERHPLTPGVGHEALAILRALQIAAARGYRRVRVRSDDNRLRTSLKERHRKGATPRTGIDARILALARSFEQVDFLWVPRRKNNTAHCLAREGRFLADDEVRHRDAEPWSKSQAATTSPGGIRALAAAAADWVPF